MQQIRKVLVGVDLRSADELVSSELDESVRRAIEQALWVGEMNGAHVTFAAVLAVPEFSTADLIEDSAEGTLLRAAGDILQQLVEQAESRGVRATSIVRTGRAWQELIHEVLREGHDLVITGSHRHSLPRRMLFSSTAMKLLRKCPCAVWITRPCNSDDVSTILVADDLTDVGFRALELGVSLAQLMSARLLVVHAVEFPFDRRLFRTGIADEEIEAYRQRVKSDSEAALNERLARTDYRTIQAGVQARVLSGPADVAIEEILDDPEQSIDLVVMGTSARGGISGLLLGNTAEQILPHIPCSLLAIKPDGFVSPVTLPEAPAREA